MDYYYDTYDKYVYKENKTLRFRETEDSIKLTIKTPTKASSLNKEGANIQNERFEYEVAVPYKDKDKNRHNIVKHLPELNDQDKWNSLKKSLTVANDRKKIHLTKNDVRFEMVFDNVKYINVNGKQKSEYQIEIELKSDYIHRINLKILSDYLEKMVPELIPMYKSKYMRGLKLTE